VLFCLVVRKIEGTVEFVVYLLLGFSFIFCCAFPVFSE